MAKTMKRTAERTAEVAYAEHAAAIGMLLGRIKTGIARHNKTFNNTNKKNWGYVGDLAHLESELREIADNLAPEDDANVVENL